ncbi:hypothetical protein [Citrobacter sp. MGH106]|uniref:hypothetical protein n=1 Tax=Citrobacter sp. MGH106 TaxID=1686381 RepID=UPI000658FBD8|nr:hypothetical protein [Citrobacter sp. MGH106]KLV66289.1 hypothetical protein SK36_00998 [Citrobacter sp. MGH106]
MTTNHPAHGPVSLDRLSLNDAIAHADERAEALFGPCAAQHAQLATWLRELQERRKADSADPVSFDELNAAVAEVTGGNQHAWNANIYKGHQEVPFMNYNSLARIVDKYRVPQPAPVVVPDGLRLALSNAGIAAPESDEMLSAKSEKLIQALVTWVKERKPFQSAPAVPEEVSWEDVPEEITEDNMEVALAWAHGFNQCRAAMLQAGNSPVTPDGWCRTCRPVTMNDMRFVVCPECGNKRCPHANDHRHACTGSNEPGQEGSAYQAAPQQEVKSALEHGMQRYAGAMQKLSEGDK